MPDEFDITDFIENGPDGLSAGFVEALEPAWRHRKAARPRDAYDFDDDQLVAATKAALLLSQPLILAGEPGVGKTSYARALADRLEIPFQQPMTVKSTTSGMGLFYNFSDVTRFRDAANGVTGGLINYVTLTGLGKAIVQSAGAGAKVVLGSKTGTEIFRTSGRPEKNRVDLRGNSANTKPPATASTQVTTLGALFPDLFRDAEAPPMRSVVLIDELDKAPRDAPNDVLAEIEDLSFRLEELDITISADPSCFPLVLISSNSERSFPDAFLRRCVFHWIEFPDTARLRRIVASRSVADGQLSPNDRLVTTAVTYFEELRAGIENKKPSTAELISFVAALHSGGYAPDDEVRADHAMVQQFSGILRKTRIDMAGSRGR